MAVCTQVLAVVRILVPMADSIQVLGEVFIQGQEADYPQVLGEVFIQGLEADYLLDPVEGCQPDQAGDYIQDLVAGCIQALAIIPIGVMSHLGQCLLNISKHMDMKEKQNFYAPIYRLQGVNIQQGSHGV